MSRFRAVHYLLCFILFFGVLSGLAGDRAVLAAEEKLELITKYPILEGKSGDSFDFEVELRWHSEEFRAFDLAATGPADWKISLLGGYEKKEIGDRIGLQPLESGKTYPTEKVTVRLAPVEGSRPEPGEYPATFEVSSGNIRESIEFKAVVTAIYRFAFFSATGLLNTEVTAGEDNHFSVNVLNTGTAVLEDISLSASEPSGWSVTFNPEEVERLEPGTLQEVDVVIKPPSKTVAGDYLITLETFSSGLPWQNIKLRVTVLTPTVWGWVGVLIVLAVIAGLAVMFRRLGRR